MSHPPMILMGAIFLVLSLSIPPAIAFSVDWLFPPPVVDAISTSCWIIAGIWDVLLFGAIMFLFVRGARRGGRT